MKYILTILTFLFVFEIKSQNILELRERAKIIDKIQNERINHLLPELMDETNIQMWVLITREYNEDPIIKTLLPSTWLNARRRTILVFYRNKSENIFEKVAITRYNFGKNIPSIWNKEKEPNQWKALSEFIISKNPKNIALNYSDHFALADGLVKTDYEAFKSSLPKSYHNKLISSEKLAIRWIETRTKFEMMIYNQLVEITHSIIKEAFSAKVITPNFVV